MKKTLVKVLAVIVFAAIGMSSFTGCAARDKTLRIYNWGEYMDESVIGLFKEWYLDEFDEKIKVVYKDFDSNETLYTSVATKGDDWDLACPSDYMIDRLIKEDKLQKIGDSVDRSVINPALQRITDTYDKNSEYSIPYLWGTFGVMYDATYIENGEDMKTWNALWNPAYSGKIYMKDQVRDSYTVALLHHYRQELSDASDGFTNYGNTEYQELLTKIFTKFDDESLGFAKAELIEQKSVLFDYETDNGKMEMAAGTTEAKLGMFWSCDAGFVMNDYETEAVGCAKASTQDGNKDLRYVVPKEGSNVWVDGWVIPKSAKNKVAAERFLQFLLTPEISKLNASYSGAPAANADAMDELKAEIEADDEFFKDTAADFKQNYLNMMFPDDTILARCAVMSDFGNMYTKMTKMFQDVRMAS